jgi:hypothetical protein
LPPDTHTAALYKLTSAALYKLTSAELYKLTSAELYELIGRARWRHRHRASSHSGADDAIARRPC